MATCKLCGAEIKFIKMKSGKWTPVNKYKHTIKECWGNETLITEQGEIIHGEFCTPEEGANNAGYISHFATCQYANEFRKG